MASIFTLILLITWLPQALYQLFIWSYWIQDKEYRVDRFLDLLNSRDSVKKLFLWQIASKMIALTVFSGDNYVYYFVLILIFLIFDFNFLILILNEGIRSPVFTQRMRRILFTSFLLVGLPIFLFWFNFIGVFRTMLISEILLIASPFIGISWTGLIVRNVKKKELASAEKLINSIKPFVIGVTGSYGKTTTKDFIHQILSTNFTTLKTEANQNTDFGIIRRILTSLKNNIKYFVVEMGAYKKGEIEKMARLVKPRIGVITGIEEQHLSLFGSIENIISAKFELVESLNEGYIAVFNLNNSHIQTLLESSEKLNKKLKIFGYGPLPENKKVSKNNLYFKIVSTGKNEIEFDVYFQGEIVRCSANIPVDYFLENLACAILIGRILKIPWNKIKLVLHNLVLPEGNMNIKKVGRNLTVIDDTHNASPTSFKKALHYIGNFKGKRLVITPGIIELGNKSKSIHTQLSKLLDAFADLIIITSRDSYVYIKSTIKSPQKVKYERNMNHVVSEIEQFVSDSKKTGNKDVILFEGRQSKIVTNYILQLK